ncbi:MAG TPA: hypothetical protein VHA10_05695 [Hypericibacter adhaerens]|nr:hypothetical protein [Hypericibacter adhaerens]HWA42683.1 hypothetical protein [Hypericibacter adhaerens]
MVTKAVSTEGFRVDLARRYQALARGEHMRPLKLEATLIKGDQVLAPAL